MSKSHKKLQGATQSQFILPIQQRAIFTNPEGMVFPEPSQASSIFSDVKKFSVDFGPVKIPMYSQSLPSIHSLQNQNGDHSQGTSGQANLYKLPSLINLLKGGYPFPMSNISSNEPQSFNSSAPGIGFGLAMPQLSSNFSPLMLSFLANYPHAVPL